MLFGSKNLNMEMFGRDDIEISDIREWDNSEQCDCEECKEYRKNIEKLDDLYTKAANNPINNNVEPNNLPTSYKVKLVETKISEFDAELIDPLVWAIINKENEIFAVFSYQFMAEEFLEANRSQGYRIVEIAE